MLALAGCLRLAAIALGLGLAGALGLTRAIDSLFGRVDANPVIFSSTAIHFASLVALAAWLRARRASKVDPMAALCAE